MDMEEFEHDELDLDDVEEQEEAGEPRNEPGRFAFGERLTQLSHHTATVDNLMEMMNEGVIDLAADYQRQFVWKLPQAQSLIDSLLHYVYVPALLFNLVVRDPNNVDEDNVPLQTWICTDGKQRLSSIYQFVQGKFSIKDADNKPWWFCEATQTKKKSTKNVFNDKERADFLALEIQVSSYDKLTTEQERRVFIKVQAGTALTAAEKASAVVSPYSEYARALATKFCSPDDTSSFTKGRRLIQGQSPAAINSMMVAISTTFDAVPKAPTASYIARTLHADPPTPPVKTKIMRAMQAFRRISILENPDGKTWLKNGKIDREGVKYPHTVWTTPKALAPVEFIFMPLLISKLAVEGNLDDGDLLEAIEMFRKVVNDSHHRAVNINATVGKTILDWITAFRPSVLTHKYANNGTLRRNVAARTSSARASSSTSSANRKPVAQPTPRPTASPSANGTSPVPPASTSRTTAPTKKRVRSPELGDVKPIIPSTQEAAAKRQRTEGNGNGSGRAEPVASTSQGPPKQRPPIHPPADFRDYR